THGYAPFAGLPKLKQAIAARYRDVYGVAVDPEREVAVLPGSKTGLMEFAQTCVERDGTIVLPDPGYPDYRSAVALAAARHAPLPLDGAGRPDWDAAPATASALYLNYPSNPMAACAPEGVFEEAIAWAERARAWVMHDFAYGDLVFDGRAPQSFLTVDGAREIGFELFSMSKSYGMAGWRLGFALGNAEVIARFEELQNHQFAGIFMPVQQAGVAALTGSQEPVDAQRAPLVPGVRPEELDHLPPLRHAAPRTEAEPRFDVLPAASAHGHTRRICPHGAFATRLQSNLVAAVLARRPWRSRGRRRRG